jgi:hypothetical protein
VKTLERMVMFKKGILFIILACLTFFCMVHINVQDAIFSQSGMGLSHKDLMAKAAKGDADARYFPGTLYLSLKREKSTESLLLASESF